MPAAGENVLKTDSSNMQKTTKYGIFQIQESAFPRTPPHHF